VSKKVIFEFIWWLIFLPATLFVSRLVYEQTYLTWLQGDQMIGFTLVHNHTSFFLITFIAFCIAFLMAVYALIKFIINYNMKKNISRYFIIKNTLLLFLLILMIIPYEWWKAITVFIFGTSEHR